MDKKMCWILIFLTIAGNVVMVQWTVEAYLGREFEQVVVYSGIGVVLAFIALIVYINWRKLEYSTEGHR
ncbi:hypothetical protein CR194_10225 [Salipaludibacillus keqinensis]|uniref:Uncharacterized protein n=1 Tax=Salipaludibacillus keqinensis TaxID=2045207 RepID=A0A323TVI6_9BACI|nr:hypothetical protein [Salipaludibacillus keqinensis]PYZ93535.1 hypothetical protein CR194_10225 [Salipaludibacillus keqinensis]